MATGDLRNDLQIECPRAKGAYLEDAPDVWGNPDWVLEPKLNGCRATMQITADEAI